jgi:hypothetical protein
LHLSEKTRFGLKILRNCAELDRLNLCDKHRGST